ncbi:putative MFS family arabinose efflux permease [Dyella sp. SG562]|uniref:MFS transporter n=2 Tax=Rhodanobacteraceae TaxID=1775411 RepID=UPI00141F2B3D|nr:MULTISPECIES: MFS transporter [unclassified Dyella]NII72217.1 putative MFS family arabinose efflux permease [Dyella sp. SG562]NKJ22581.1 putative MFS family arabinose efflux permease [Dyella sp. SG609]
MTIQRHRPFGQNYAFVVVAVVFLALLASAGMRATPGVLMLPLGRAFGWSRDSISSAAAVGILLYGLMGPFAAALMQRFGIRRVLLVALSVMTLAAASSALMSQPWQLVATWGVLSGAGTGCVAVVMGATVVGRWFSSHRGLMMGLLTASTATGTLIFLPGLAAIAEYFGWQAVVLTIAAVSAVLIPLAWWLLPERPSDIGLRRYGATADEPADAGAAGGNLFALTLGVLRNATRNGTFWLLFATFFVCGFTTNGLIGTHFIALCGDHGIPEVRAAGLLAMMGIFDLVGTTASGWLTDRFDPRKLLFVYYGLRGLSLMYLPYSDFSFYSLSLFGVFYGLDWIATVPPTLRLTTDAFGERDAPIVFGWVVAGHQVGAAAAAFMAGVLRVQLGSYMTPFVIAGAAGVVAAFLALRIGRRRDRGELPALAGEAA